MTIFTIIPRCRHIDYQTPQLVQGQFNGIVLLCENSVVKLAPSFIFFFHQQHIPGHKYELFNAKLYIQC